MNAAVCITPRVKPSSAAGATLATRVRVAETVPEKAPCTVRRARSCKGERARAIRATVIPPPKRARTTIALRPWRSASVPQMGATVAITTIPQADITPAQRAASRGSAMPSSWT